MKTIAFILLLSIPSMLLADHPNDLIQVTTSKGSNGITVNARNTDTTLTRWIDVQLQGAVNVNADRGLPVMATLLPGASQVLMVLRVANPSQGASYQLSSSQGFGDPNAVPDNSIAYLLPYANGTKHCVTQGYLGQISHQGIYALDFDLAQGTTICAARDGIVATVKQDSDTGGASSYYAQMGNYIDILHPDGTWSTYAHIELNGALVHEGDQVKAGDPIALSGATGEATGPHLHFSVQKAQWGADPLTYATPFQLDVTQTAYLEEGKYYYSWHPNSPPFERILAADIDQEALEQKVTPITRGKVRFREDKIDNMVFLYGDNPLQSSIKVNVDFSQSQNVQASKDLPLIKVIPPQSEVFLMSILMKGQSSYQTSVSYTILQ